MRETAKRLSRSALCSAHNNRRRQRSASPSRLPAERKILTAKVARLRTTLGANGVWVGEGFCAGLHSPAGSFCPVEACASQPNGALIARHFFWQTSLTPPEFLPSWTGRLCGNDFMKNDDMRFRPLRRAPKGFAFGNHRLLKKAGENFILQKLGAAAKIRPSYRCSLRPPAAA